MAVSSEKKTNPTILRSAALISLGTLSSRILGMLRDMILASHFSATLRDAFAVAFKLPNLFRRLFGEGSLAVSFIPVYIEKKEGAEQGGASPTKDLRDAMFSILFVLTSALAATGIIFMPTILRALAGGAAFLSVPGKFEMTLYLARAMFGYLFLVTNYAFFSSLLNAHRRFFLPAVAPAAFNFVFIGFALCPEQSGLFHGSLLGWGVLAAGVVQAAVVGVALRRMGILPRFRWRWRVAGIGVVLKNMVPGILGMGVLQLMSLVNTRYASGLPEGSLSHIYYADRLLEFPQSLIAISMGTALLPTLSSLWSSGQKPEMLKVAHEHMRLMLFFALPCAVGLFFLAQPIVEVLFMRGQFSKEHAIVTGEIVKVYAPLLVILGLHKVMVPNFYAMKNTWVPALGSGLALLIHIGLAPHMMDRFGITGLVGSSAVAALFNLCLIALFYLKFLGSLRLIQLTTCFLQMVPALLILGSVAHFVYHGSIDLLSSWPIWLAQVLSLGLSIVLAGVSFFVVGVLVKQPEVTRAMALINRRRNSNRAT